MHSTESLTNLWKPLCNIRIGYKILQNLHRLGVTYLSYAYDAQDKKYVFFSNNKWQKFYIKNDIQKFDPVRIASHSSVQLIRWDSLAGAKLSNELMKERENICNIHSGFSLVFKNLQKTEILSVVTDKYFKHIYS